jgi:hypothetical protein
MEATSMTTATYETARKRHIRLTIDIKQELTPAQEQSLIEQVEHGLDPYCTPIANIPVYADGEDEPVEFFDLAPVDERGYPTFEVESVDIADDHMTKADEIAFALSNLLSDD